MVEKKGERATDIFLQPQSYSKKRFWIIQLVGFGPLILVLISTSFGSVGGVQELTEIPAMIVGLALPMIATSYSLKCYWITRKSREKWTPFIISILELCWVVVILMIMGVVG